MVDWLSLAVPLAYLGILIGSLATFSSLYRKRKARTFLSSLSSLNPQPHITSNPPLSLRTMTPAASSTLIPKLKLLTNTVHHRQGS